MIRSIAVSVACPIPDDQRRAWAERGTHPAAGRTGHRQPVAAISARRMVGCSAQGGRR